MITSDDALNLARKYLADRFPGHDLVIVESLERPIGWGIVYQFRNYMETRDPDDMLIGPGPLLVLRSDGSIAQLRTFQPLEDEIRDASFAEALRRLRDAALTPAGIARGCTERGIADVEQTLSVRLPDVYRAFLLQLGENGGSFMQGSDFACRELVQMNTLARKLVRDTGASIPDNAFVFLMHQGYQFLYFLVGEESDPQVHLFDDGGTLKPIGLTFADWFLRTTDEEIEIWRGLKD